MKITPKSEEEVGGSFENLPPGEYPFSVLEAGISVSQSAKNPGKEFIKVKLLVHGPNFDRHIFDQFSDWFSEWKLKHFCETVGRAAEYVSGMVLEGNDWQGLEGYCKLKIKPAEGNYPAKNEVVDYLPEESQTVEKLPARPDAPPAKKEIAETASPIENDDVPF